MNRGQWLMDQLPLAMLDDDFMVRFLGIFQSLADTFMVQADNIEHVVDVSVAPDHMVRYMGSWIAAQDVDESLPDVLQRRIVRTTGRILPWRGTAYALEQLLELITDRPAIVEDSGGVYAEGEAPTNPNHVRIVVESTGWATEEDLLEFVQAQLPAFVSFELVVGDRRIWPTDDHGTRRDDDTTTATEAA